MGDVGFINEIRSGKRDAKPATEDVKSLSVLALTIDELRKVNDTLSAKVAELEAKNLQLERDVVARESKLTEARRERDQHRLSLDKMAGKKDVSDEVRQELKELKTQLQAEREYSRELENQLSDTKTMQARLEEREVQLQAQLNKAMVRVEEPEANQREPVTIPSRLLDPISLDVEVERRFDGRIERLTINEK